MAEVAATPLLRLDSITKSFGPVQALRGVSLDIHAGEVHALIGENGAGKSTLMKVLSGAHAPDSGSIQLFGEPLTLQQPMEARRAGIAMIYQELTLAPHLTVEENMTLGMESSRFGFISSRSRRVSEVLESLGCADILPHQKVQDLTISRQQIIEIARAMMSETKVVIMDEPTSSLSEEDKRALFQVINNLRNNGLAVIYISHFLDEIKEIADRYTVLRDGESVGEGLVADAPIESLVECMIGRKLDDMYPAADHELGEIVLTADSVHGVFLPRDVSLDLREGEILGIFGLVGSGRTELARCLFGLDDVKKGTVRFRQSDEMDLGSFTPERALDNGLDFLSEDRKEEGLAQNMSITQNTTLSALSRTSWGGLLKLKAEKQEADLSATQLGVKCNNTQQTVSDLSGGNQQKVALARMIYHDSDVLLMDEPTRGIDVGSKHEIYEVIHELARSGKSLIVISSYLPELMGICSSLAVMHRGTLSSKQPVDAWTENAVMQFATTGKLAAQGR